MYTGLRGSVSLKYLITSSLRDSLALFQVSITFWNLSTAVISPRPYLCSVNLISSFVLYNKSLLVGGTRKSSTLREIPAFVA